MERVNFFTRTLSSPRVYRLWQVPFTEQKLVPLFQHNDVRAARRVLDVGCGPGTNTRHFASADYLGLDLSPEYVQYATKRYSRNFQVADITTFQPPTGERFDLVLMNSFLHHIDDASTVRILKQVQLLLTEDGHVHIFDLVLPEERGMARFLAQQDRGEHPRPLETWRKLFMECFEPVLFLPYPLQCLGVTLWNMVYFKGRAKS